MKFIISSTGMLSSLTAVSKAISAKPVVPILENILIEAKEGELYATASDRETTIITKLNTESIEGEGKIAMSTKLIDILKEFPELPLQLETNAETTAMKLTSEKGKFDVPGASADEYPIPNICGDAETVINTTCSIMLDGIKKSEFAGGQSFVIETSTGSIFYNNSFLPLIKIRLKPIGEKTEIAILFEMKFSVKIISVWLVLLWIFMFTSMVVISIKDNLPLSYEIFLMPVILVALMSLVNIIGLRITSKSKFKVFLEEFGFNPKDKENSPKLVWVKIFGSTKVN